MKYKGKAHDLFILALLVIALMISGWTGAKQWKGKVHLTGYKLNKMKLI